MDSLSQMAVAGRDPMLDFAQNLGPQLRSHRSTGRGEPGVHDQLAKIKSRVKEIQEREQRDRRRQARAVRKAAQEGITGEPEPEPEPITALDKRLQWTKSVEQRLRTESAALSAKIAREEAEHRATVAALTRNVLGKDDLGITGRFAGHESEVGSKLRRGGLAVRGERDPEKHPMRQGRRGVLHGRRSVGGKSEEQLRRGPSPENMEKAYRQMHAGRISAPPHLGGREPTGCLPVEVMGRDAARKATLPPSQSRSTFVDHGGSKKTGANPQLAREWRKADSVVGGQTANQAQAAYRPYDTHEFGKLKGQIIALQKEAARIDGVMGTRTRMLAVPSPAFPVRADDGPALSKY
jgi:hypothetical protein